MPGGGQVALLVGGGLPGRLWGLLLRLLLLLLLLRGGGELRLQLCNHLLLLLH